LALSSHKGIKNIRQGVSDEEVFFPMAASPCRRIIFNLPI
jgi:hypothetical protein